MEKLMTLFSAWKINDFSQVDKATQERAIRKELCNIFGKAEGEKITMKDIRGAKHEFFSFMEDMVKATLPATLEGTIGQFAEVMEVREGEQAVFDVENDELFKVYTVADGNGNLVKQRITGKKVIVPTEVKAIAFYDELTRFMSGKVDLASMLNKMNASFLNQVYNDVYDAIYASYSGLGSNYGKTGSFTVATLRELIARVEASTGSKAVIYGSKVALSKVAPAGISENMKDAFNQQGFYGVFEGTPMVEVRQAYKNGTQTFAIADDFLLVLPIAGESIVKIAMEGEPFMEEFVSKATRATEFQMIQKVGCAVVSANKYGIYKVS